jgi:hypothetical protein
MVGGLKTATLLLFFENDRMAVPEACVATTNVMLNFLGHGGVAALHAQRILTASGLKPQLTNTVQKKLELLFQLAPASLPEFKPTWGWVFGEYLSEYSHWTYTDADVVFGRWFCVKGVEIRAGYAVGLTTGLEDLALVIMT